MSIIKISEVKDLPLDLIDIGLSQARTSDIDEGIEELAASIEKIGLLEPIVVFPKNERYFKKQQQIQLLRKSTLRQHRS
jgi:hypothetical protein